MKTIEEYRLLKKTKEDNKRLEEMTKKLWAFARDFISTKYKKDGKSK